MRVVTAEEMRRIENDSEKLGTSRDALMENAGAAVADAVFSKTRWDSTTEKTVVVLVGPGNNGGDGLVAARILTKKGVNTHVFTVCDRRLPDPKMVSAADAGVEVHNLSTESNLEQFRSVLDVSDVVIDAILGSGNLRPIQGMVKKSIELANRSEKTIFAIDLPTGLCANTGRFDPNGIKADKTLMLGFHKIGPLIEAATVPTGEMQVLDIGIPKEALLEEPKTKLIDKGLASSLLPKRKNTAHKGSHGRLLIVAGSQMYPGAAILSAMGAVRSGVGLVHLAMGTSIYAAVAGKVPEAICHPLPEKSEGALDANKAAITVLSLSESCDSVLIGPGLGQGSSVTGFLRNLVFCGEQLPAAVLDADCLNFLAASYRWQDRTPLNAILTPHPGEMSRLMSVPVSSVQQNRLKNVRDAATLFGQVAMLKGPATLVANNEGEVNVSPWVNPGLASGGTGDVLAGLTAGLLAQMPEKRFAAATLGVYLHGYAGDLSAKAKGNRAMTAGDVANALPEAFKAID